MLLFALIGIALAGIAATYLARAAASGRVRAVETLAQIDAYGYGASIRDEKPRGTLRYAVDALADRVGSVLSRRDSTVRDLDMRRRLMAAGFYRVSPRTFLGYRVLGALVGGLFVLWLVRSADAPAVLAFLGTVLFAFAGWIAPQRVVTLRGRSRLDQIERRLPELIDLLVVTVEAGLGFSGSLRVASERLDGPLGEELRLTLQEQTMGLSTLESLRNMLTRSDTPSMRSFVRSVLQGEALGVSIGQILRNLAHEMRKRRRSAAEERAQKAPIKILFPLIFLIFPAMFVVLLGPAVFSFIEAFGNR